MSQPPPSRRARNKLPGHFAASQPPPSYASPAERREPTRPDGGDARRHGCIQLDAAADAARIAAAGPDDGRDEQLGDAGALRMVVGAIAGAGMGGAVMDPPGTSVTFEQPACRVVPRCRGGCSCGVVSSWCRGGRDRPARRQRTHAGCLRRPGAHDQGARDPAGRDPATSDEPASRPHRRKPDACRRARERDG